MTIDELADIGRFECPVCDHRFTTLSDKKAHLRAAHPRSKA
jgi:hypothetical protein